MWIVAPFVISSVVEADVAFGSAIVPPKPSDAAFSATAKPVALNPVAVPQFDGIVIPWREVPPMKQRNDGGTKTPSDAVTVIVCGLAVAPATTSALAAPVG
ncbi:MAG: hypothetical protein ACRD1G_04535, partial [Acidimicrobiales bacterium]